MGTLWVVITGSPIDGFTIYGPFPEWEDAEVWANNEADESWWITNIESS